MGRTLSGRTAVVTGSFAGLGFGVAAALAARGANVVLNGLCARETGDGAAAAIAAAHGVGTWFCDADLSSVPAIEAMVAGVAERFGRTDIIVNNAVVRHFKPVQDFSAAEWDTSIAVNLSAAFHLARLCVPGMLEAGWGRIVNMSSIYGARGAENRIDYVTTKTALLGMTRALAIELAKTGITVNAVSPGTVPTEAILGRIEAQAKASGQSVEAATSAYLVGRNPTGRFVEIEGVGALVAFLCSDEAADINGATLPIDGGWQAA